tara:strand:+ start:64 stop:426 length:363 start_codon:yes stop_codon:yes gene_type:complete
MDIGSWQIVIVIIIFCVVWIQLAKKARTKEVEQYNKKHNKNFKTWEELEKYRKDESEKIIEKEKKAKEEKKRREKLERTPRANYESSSNLGASLKRLKKMYNDGHLSKVEFEKAKNKLLK